MKFKTSDELAWLIANKINSIMELWLDIPTSYANWWHGQDTLFVRSATPYQWLTLSKTRVNMKWWFDEELAHKLYKIYIDLWIDFALRTRWKWENAIVFLSNDKRKLVIE